MELVGGNFIAKIFCGFANWIGHIMSDIAGDTGSRGNGHRGMGIVMPFYELFNLCEFGKFSDGKGNKQTLAKIATRAYTEGYDARFGLAMAIPVIITNISIRFIWGIRSYFSKHKSIEQCIPTNNHNDLRMMLIVGNGTLCVLDGIDAGIKSGGNFLAFFMRLNLVAWLKLVRMVIKEICLRVGVSDEIYRQLQSMQMIDTAIHEYLEKIKEYDIEKYEFEALEYVGFVEGLDKSTNSQELSTYLIESYHVLELPLPWQGDFDTFMNNENNTLVFE